MDTYVAELAGAERSLRLRLGEFLNIEDQLKIGMGAVYQRFGLTTYFASDVRVVLEQALIGGGMSAAEAKKLILRELDLRPLGALAAIATDVIIQAMTGIQSDELSEPSDPDVPIDKGQIFHSFIQLGVTPQMVREMAYADFVAIMRKAGGKDVQPPSEGEFEEMRKAWEARQEA